MSESVEEPVPREGAALDGSTRAADPSPDVDGSTVDAIDAALLGGPRELSLRDLAMHARVGLDVAADFWRALGLPHADPDDPVYTTQDADAVVRAAALVREHGLDAPTVGSLTRALGHTSDRLALWQVEALVEDMANRYELDDASARLLVLDRLVELAPVLEAQLVHTYRRHLAAISGRYAAEFAQLGDPGPDTRALPLARAVGFADMVSFTRRTAGLGSTDLSQFVQRFEAAARDVVTENGGRVVKTIGDAVLFVADDAGTGAAVACGLAAAFERGADERAAEAGDAVVTDPGGTARRRRPGRATQAGRGVMPVRVSLVWGRVLSRFGDVFGPTVNLAARLVDVAEPSTVLTDPVTAETLRHDPRFRLDELPPLDLDGIGLVHPVRLATA